MPGYPCCGRTQGSSKTQTDAAGQVFRGTLSAGARPSGRFLQRDDIGRHDRANRSVSGTKIV